MTMYTHPLPLGAGLHVTVTPWTMAETAAHTTDYRAALDTLTAALRGQPAPLDDHACTAVLARLTRVSLTRPEDAAHVGARDLPALLEALWDVNGLGEYLKKALLRHLGTEAWTATLPLPHPSP